MVNQYVIESFIDTALTNDITNISAALPRTHKLIQTNKATQIRKVKGILAQGTDTLGNQVILTTNLQILQII